MIVRGQMYLFVKMGRKILICMFIICFGGSIVSAEFLNLDIGIEGLNSNQTIGNSSDAFEEFTNYSVFLYSFQVVNFKSFYNGGVGNFEVITLTNEGSVLYKEKFNPDFIIYSTPPSESDFSIINLQVPYTNEVKYLKINWDDSGNLVEKLSVNISDLLCNNNGSCDMGENYHSCSQDCEWYSEDDLCLSYSGDKFCDPDCYNDEDCESGSCNQGTYSGEECSADGSCSDGLKNSDEEGIDCGGRCIDLCEFVSLNEIIMDWFGGVKELDNTLFRLKNYFSVNFSAFSNS